MVLKWDFNISGSTTDENIMVDAIAYINDATRGLFIYTIVLYLFFIAAYVYIKTTSDVGLGFTRAFYIGMVLSTILFYFGVSVGTTFILPKILLAMVLIFATSMGALYYDRNTLSGGGR